MDIGYEMITCVSLPWDLQAFFNSHPNQHLRKMAEGGNPDISTAPLPMRYTSMGYTPMRYTSTALYFYTEHTQVRSQFFN